MKINQQKEKTMQNHDNIKIILCRTWDPGNIGSSLRAMKNFDFKNVVAVNQINFDEEKSSKMAAGAKDHHQYLRNSDNLKEEIKDCQVVYAFTARKRRHIKIITPHIMSEEILLLPENTKIALIYGNETNGLNNEEVAVADKLVMIPTSENYSSLNLASAILVSLYEIYKNKVRKIVSNENPNNLKQTIMNPYPKEPIISKEEKEKLHDFVSNIICTKIINQKKHTKQFSENIKYFFNRMFLNKKEMNFIKTIFKVIEKKIK